jgi:hypothetical protein
MSGGVYIGGEFDGGKQEFWRPVGEITGGGGGNGKRRKREERKERKKEGSVRTVMA